MTYASCPEQCGGCSRCRPELGDHCEAHGPGYSPDPLCCEACLGIVGPTPALRLSLRETQNEEGSDKCPF
jgi:hypothetical protein